MSELGEMVGDLYEGHTHSFGFVSTYVFCLRNIEVRCIICPDQELRLWFWVFGGAEVAHKMQGCLNLIVFDFDSQKV